MLREVIAKIFSSMQRLPFSSKNCVFKEVLDPEELIPYLQRICQNTLYTIINCFTRFVTLDNARKYGPKAFVTVKTAFFINICFYRPLRSQKLILTFGKQCQKTFWTLNNCSSTFVMLVNRRKKGLNFFSHQRVCNFFKKVVINNLLGPNEMILYLR